MFWKEAMEKKGLRIRKTKIMISGMGLDLLQSSDEFPCAVCHTGSGQQQHLLQRLQVLGAQEMQWAQALDKGLRIQMYTVPGNCTPLDGRPQREVQVGPDKLEVVASFCYLGDMLSVAGGCEHSTTTRVKTAWKFKELLPVLFPTTSLSRHVAACTALVCRAQ